MAHESKGQSTAPVAVIITDQDHPHFRETGILTGKTISVAGERLAEMELLACDHGCEGCFVGAEQVQRVP